LLCLICWFCRTTVTRKMVLCCYQIENNFVYLQLSITKSNGTPLTFVGIGISNYSTIKDLRGWSQTWWKDVKIRTTMWADTTNLTVRILFFDSNFTPFMVLVIRSQITQVFHQSEIATNTYINKSRDIQVTIFPKNVIWDTRRYMK
jgi:hypothetical protein